MPNFSKFFTSATQLAKGPYPYQEGLALSSDFPRLLDVPTGMGKTAAVVLAWLYRRRHHPDEPVRNATPRRLVYCLPMRTLVEQTEKSVSDWLANLGCERDVSVHVLMGGEEKTDWDLYPERDAILIGTQDMLLSRALNRGYGMSRYRWPMHFALLNNDALWVFDEVQLMDAGVATTSQLDGFRRNFETYVATHSLWMSATLDRDWLNTIDFDLNSLGEPHGLTGDDRRIDAVNQRLNAAKSLRAAEVSMGDAGGAARRIFAEHASGTRTLAVFNTVKRALEVYRELQKLKPEAETVLIHSRFRPQDRAKKMEQLLQEPRVGGTIAITTQVVEAGVDVSAKTLFTELAPWSSLVQRFGRCNRAGEFTEEDPGRVFWFDLPGDEKECQKVEKPYQRDELLDARAKLQSCSDVGPASLTGIVVKQAIDAPHVIRRRDLLDLYDTTPDLAGNDIDVSRFIRSGEEFDVQVFWRNLTETAPDRQTDGRSPHRRELCRAPVGEFRDFVKKKAQGKAWRWDALDRRWASANQQDVYPGQTFLVHASAGGYDEQLGWNPASKAVQPVAEETGLPEGNDDDPFSCSQIWQTIAEHTDEVVRELDVILSECSLDDDQKRTLETAARWHDWGKAHEVFQSALPDNAPDQTKLWAKAAGTWKRYARRHFRHELASALAMLALKTDDFAAYIVAAHHGKVRLSIRSLPGERTPDDDPDRLFARGVWDGDTLPETELGGETTAPAVTLSLECMQLGRSESGEPSWTERMLKLRDKYGPFRLAFFEALLRAADMRASNKAAKHNPDQQEIAP